MVPVLSDQNGQNRIQNHRNQNTLNMDPIKIQERFTHRERALKRQILELIDKIANIHSTEGDMNESI
jgi:hypothetical protein